MMTQTQAHAVGTLSRPDAVEHALNQLKSNQFPLERISVLGKNTDVETPSPAVAVSDQVGEQQIGRSEGVVGDAVNAATWGSILVAGGSFVIPGVGPFLALGGLGAALVGGLAGVGLSAVQISNLQKSMAELGMNEDHARFYADRLLMGDYLIFVNGSAEEISQAQEMLQPEGVQNWSTW